jgi:RHS repeat-associated protein
MWAESCCLKLGVRRVLDRRFRDHQGRWLSPDPYAGSLDSTDPQSFNRYAYVGNDPINSRDPSGLCKVADCEKMPIFKPLDLFSGIGSLAILSYAFQPSFGIITPANDGFVHNGQLTLYLYFGNWDMASLIGMGFPDAGYISHQLGPNAKSIQTCKAALKTAGANQAGVNRTYNNWGNLKQAGAANGVGPELLGAIGLRESDFIPNRVEGGGHGRGAFQIDCCGAQGKKPPAHPEVSEAQAFNVGFASNFAAKLLGRTAGKYSFLGSMALPAAIRDYNAGGRYTVKKAVLGIPALDRGTTGNNYVSNVLALTDCFQ